MLRDSKFLFMPLDLLVVFVAISVLILVHEVGHFLAARFFGVWVEEFGLGLPPKLISKKIGETIYSVNLLPLGGFVRLHGEDQPPSGKIKKPGRAFFKKPWWQRSIILLAGVFMNFFLAVLILSYIFTKGITLPDRVQIKEVILDSPAAVAGIQKEDILIAIDGIKVTDVETVTKLIQERLDKQTTLEVERKQDDQTTTEIIKATPRKNPPPNEGALGVVLYQLVIIKSYPFYTAPFYGLKEAVKMSGQLIVAITGVFWNLISRFTVPKDVAGPIGIYQLYGEARKYGVSAILELSGLISLNLAVINLFPIPPLDGSRLLFIVAQRVTGKSLKKEWEEKLYQISFLLLIVLFILISIQDIKRLFGF